MQIRRSIASILLAAGVVAGAGAITPALADVTITQSNDAEDAEAQSGQSDAQNSNGTAHAGPQAGGGIVVQEGDNEVDQDQRASARSGETVSGSQVTGVAASGDADVTIDNRNVSDDAEASSGSSSATNDGGSVSAGAVLGGGGLVFQDGDNELSLGQAADAATGDAVAGGQVTGVSAL